MLALETLQLPTAGEEGGSQVLTTFFFFHKRIKNEINSVGNNTMYL